MVKRIFPAKHYQRRDAPIRLIAERGKVAIRRDLKGALEHLGTLVDLKEVTRAIEARHYQNIERGIDWAHFREVLKAPFDRIVKVREAAATLGVRKINGAFAARRRSVSFKKMGISQSAETEATVSLDELFDADAVAKAGIGERFNFDRFNQDTLDRIRADQDALIKQLTTDARNTIDAIVSAGVTSGLGPADIAGDIREFIGLTDTQATAVLNYRRQLEELDRGALRRQLRNKELDPAVQAALDDGTSLDDALIDRATSDYEDNYLDYRAATIAQTESVRASNAGLHDAYQQAVERGALPDEAITRNWQVALDERTCPICLSIPEQNPNGVGVDEQFDSEDEPIDDPPVHPNCRCSVEYVTDLDKVPDQSAEEP